ncbi:MAG TPA: hypothetical protein VKU84_15870, partial [Stellaceae bacterium]|nr:hypothetical protein [Stellaceae bacterium]
MLCGGRRCGSGTFTNLPPGRLAGPRARIDLAHQAQPFLGFGERGEITHVQPEALAALLEAPADEE